MTVLTEYAPAKVNLSLHVGPVKANRRHDLKSLVVFADESACDILEAEPASSFSLAVEGPFARDAGPARDNLVLQAARALGEALDGTAPPLAFRLTKRLPCSAGIGGGSADAAAALRLIIRAHGGDRVMALAETIAPQLGGDVLACLIAMPGLMSGEGEVFEPMPGLAPLPALLVNPGVACPTGAVFAAFDARGESLRPHPLPKTGRADASALRAYLSQNTANTLQAPAMSLVPEIAIVLDTLGAFSGTDFVRMSGSGATCFALFETMDGAEAAADKLAGTHPDWWVAATMLGAG